MDQILFGHNSTYDDFSILIPENNEFTLHLKESLLIKRDKPELNRKIHIYPFELFAWIIALLTASYFYENLDNSSLL